MATLRPALSLLVVVRSCLVCSMICGCFKTCVVQVNYTRKVQHFAAYLVPLLFSPSKECNCRGTLEVLSELP